METVKHSKILWIFLTLLTIVGADHLPTQSYLSSYLQQQRYEVQHQGGEQLEQTSRQRGEPQRDARNKDEQSPVKEPALECPKQHQLTNPIQSLADGNYNISPIPPKHAYTLLQARPPQSATFSSNTNTKPIWRNTTPANGEAIYYQLDAKDVEPTNSHNKFNADLFQVIVGSLPHKNIVYSPISLQLLLAFVYTGARGQTALQLQRALSLPGTILETEYLFASLLLTQFRTGNTQLVLANKIYHNHQLTAKPHLKQRASYFGSDIEAIDFGRPNAAAKTINDWVAHKTQNIIRQLVPVEQLNAQIQAILVSAIHFKAKWLKEFSMGDTEQQKFYVEPDRIVNVSMMYNLDTYRYAQFPELEAKGLEMQYKNTNMSMLLLLPNKLNGLAAMEQRLHGVDLNTLTTRMQEEFLEVGIPKFTVDFELDMREPLRKLGVLDLFTSNVDLSGFFGSQQVAVSQMQHKAFLDVNEAGSEAAAASFIKLVPLMVPHSFTVDHPFMFAIRSPQAVFFIGHIINIQ